MQPSPECQPCQRKQAQVEKLLAENLELHELAAHYRERYNQLMQVIRQPAEGSVQ